MSTSIVEFLYLESYVTTIPCLICKHSAQVPIFSAKDVAWSKVPVLRLLHLVSKKFTTSTLNLWTILN